MDAEQPVDNRDGEPGAILARNAVDKARRIIFGERREIEPQRRDERRAIGHAGIGVDHPVARRLDVDRAARRLKMRRETRSASRRSEEHTSELQSLMRISYAVFCLKKKTLSITYYTT